jgi:type VI secretion system protein VasD
MNHRSTMEQSNACDDRVDGQRRQLLLAGIGLTLVGCAASPPAAPVQPKIVEPTNLVITIAARSDVNPDIRGRASPLSLRLFELKSATAFQTADFFALYDRDQATLGGDMLGREELIVRPGETQSITRKANPDTRLVGIIAAFRDLEHSVWRTSVAVPPPTEAGRGAAAGSRDLRISVVCDRTSVRIE